MECALFLTFSNHNDISTLDSLGNDNNAPIRLKIKRRA